MSLSLIAAVAENGCIGKNNDVPWHLPEDLKRFKALTLGHAVLMGRKTYESILKRLGKPLPGRTSIVITRQPKYTAAPGVFVYTNLNNALKEFQHESIFCIGGGELYTETLPGADMLYLTEVHQTIEGDTFFPTFDRTQWVEKERENKEGYSFVIYERT